MRADDPRRQRGAGADRARWMRGERDRVDSWLQTLLKDYIREYWREGSDEELAIGFFRVHGVLFKPRKMHDLRIMLGLRRDRKDVNNIIVRKSLKRRPFYEDLPQLYFDAMRGGGEKIDTL